MINNIEQRFGDIWTASLRVLTGRDIRDIPDKAFEWSRDNSGTITAGWGKIDAEELFVGDVYFDKSLKARVKILNKSENDAVTVKGK